MIRTQRIDTPALFRALADVAQLFAHTHPELEIRCPYLYDAFSQPDLKRICLSVGMELHAPLQEFKLALGAAYKRHGGDPSLFLSPPELLLLDAAPPAEVDNPGC